MRFQIGNFDIGYQTNVNVLDKEGLGKCEKNRGRVVCMSASNLNNLKFAKK